MRYDQEFVELTEDEICGRRKKKDHIDIDLNVQGNDEEEND